MAKKLEFYKCIACGNITEVLHGGGGVLICCGEPMVSLVAKTTEDGKEKHVPVIEQSDSGLKVKVGSVAHPMEEKHYIEWIEILADGKMYRQFLNPGDAPEATFGIQAGEVVAREHCSIHGLWEGK